MIILFNVIIFIVYVCDQIIEYQLELLGDDATACACSQQQEQCNGNVSGCSGSMAGSECNVNTIT